MSNASRHMRFAIAAIPNLAVWTASKSERKRPIASDSMSLNVRASHTASLPAAPLPKGMQLLQAHVVFRHGEKFFGTERNAVFPSFPLEQPQHGDLTDQGRARMRHLGEQLAKAYASLQLVPGSDVYLYCCKPGVHRTRHWESLQCVLSGMWPNYQLNLEHMDVNEPGTHGVTLRERSEIASSEQIARLAKLWHNWRAINAAEHSKAAQHPSVTPLISEATVLDSKWSLGKQNGPMHRLCIRLAYSLQHGEQLPTGMDPDYYLEISEACHVEDFALFEKEEAAKLYLGMFFHELLERSQRTIEGRASPKLFLYSSNDYVLGPLLSALRVPLGRWPDVGSFVAIELWEQTATKEIFIRVTRNSAIMTSILGMQTQSGGMMPWADFVANLRPRVLYD